jgi:hypothetical protein
MGKSLKTPSPEFGFSCANFPGRRGFSTSCPDSFTPGEGTSGKGGWGAYRILMLWRKGISEFSDFTENYEKFGLFVLPSDQEWNHGHSKYEADVLTAQLWDI